jgi:hypothetical protein
MEPRRRVPFTFMFVAAFVATACAGWVAARQRLPANFADYGLTSR